MARTVKPVPLQDIRDLPVSYQRWFDTLKTLLENQITGVVPWTQVSKAGANITDIPNRAHNNLTAFDGGGSGEYFHLSSSQHSSIVNLNTYTTNQTLTSVNGKVLCDATSGNITITLASAAIRKTVHIKKVDSSANTVTITRAGSDTIEGNNSVTLSNQYDYYTLYSDGSITWYIEGKT